MILPAKGLRSLFEPIPGRLLRFAERPARLFRDLERAGLPQVRRFYGYCASDEGNNVQKTVGSRQVGEMNDGNRAKRISP